MSSVGKPLNRLFAELPTTIFSVMTALATQHNSINLGQGFPDEEGPEKMKSVVGSAVFEHHNQYPPYTGVPETRQAVARHSAEQAGLQLNWQTDTLITVGATSALAATFLSFLNNGDEAIFFEPLYDAYLPLAARCGAVIKTVKLDPRDWSVPHKELAAAFSDKTKLILVNSPHNPTGKVFSREDLQFIADLCIRHNAYAVLDEVYEHLVFPGHRHVSLRLLPGMAERSVRIGSAGKTFSFTAWKVGWVTGPADLVSAITKAHSYMIFTVPSNLQRAVAYGLDNEQSFFLTMGASLQKKRDYLAGRLESIGFKVLQGQGTYFLVADFSPLRSEGSDEGDVDFCHRITTEAGVTGLPVSAFYTAKQDAPKTLVRFCFCKDDAKLVKACDLLETYFKK